MSNLKKVAGPEDYYVDTHKKQCVVTDHGFVEPVAQSQINSICYDLFNQGQRVDHIQLFRNDENGNYTSFISYTVLKEEL